MLCVNLILTQLTSQASELCASDEHTNHIQQTLQVKVVSGNTVESIGDRKVLYLKCSKLDQ